MEKNQQEIYHKKLINWHSLLDDIFIESHSKKLSHAEKILIMNAQNTLKQILQS